MTIYENTVQSFDNISLSRTSPQLIVFIMGDNAWMQFYYSMMKLHQRRLRKYTEQL